MHEAWTVVYAPFRANTILTIEMVEIFYSVLYGTKVAYMTYLSFPFHFLFNQNKPLFLGCVLHMQEIY